MMINIYEAKTQLSRLIERVEAGEEIVIARAGKPVAKLIPVETRTKPRPIGLYEGQIWVADDIDKVDEEIADLINESPLFPSDHKP